MAGVETFDFHVTSECSQECAYCWGPQGVDAVDTDTALAIISKIASGPTRRIVFTGGDPLQRSDIGLLIRAAAEGGLEVAVSTTGDLLTEAFLDTSGPFIDLISLPLDGSTEAISARTKKPGHYTAVMEALDLFEIHAGIDVKIATPVTRYNIGDVPNIALLLDERAKRLPGRLFYNVFQAFPRSMDPDVAWDEMVVDNASFAELRRRVDATPHDYRINWLGHETLDKLYVMVFPDGSLTVPSGSQFRNFGPFLEIDNLDTLLDESDFDEPKHQRHAQGWSRSQEHSPT
jgi:MoaA/NifB/PqqE/SkfB family radical SAM enzyme